MASPENGAQSAPWSRVEESGVVLTNGMEPVERAVDLPSPELLDRLEEFERVRDLGEVSSRNYFVG